MERHLMLDIETLGNVPNSIILSIGAVVFNPINGDILDEFKININRLESLSMGFIITPSTMEWWASQDHQVFAMANKNPQNVIKSINDFRDFVIKNSITKVWGNSVSFDCVLLKCYFDKLNIITPWEFWQESCFRTIKQYLNTGEHEFIGIPHNAIDDCKHQIKQLVHALNKADIKL